MRLPPGRFRAPKHLPQGERPLRCACQCGRPVLPRARPDDACGRTGNRAGRTAILANHFACACFPIWRDAMLVPCGLRSPISAAPRPRDQVTRAASKSGTTNQVALIRFSARRLEAVLRAARPLASVIRNPRMDQGRAGTSILHSDEMLPDGGRAVNRRVVLGSVKVTSRGTKTRTRPYPVPLAKAEKQLWQRFPAPL